MKKNFIIATAGHIDHGKTSLIKTLTGKDCDTHPEEKKRGITIHLGFSHLKLNEDVNVGIIDVPGHKDFIHNMISGVCGIDLVLFVIAANEGMMPQSIEHLKILNLLNVSKGIIVLTKCDLVDNELIEIAEQEIKNEFSKTTLKDCPILKVSTKTGENINFIIPELIKILKSNDYDFNQEYFRLYPDRYFQVKGFGSVLTGSVLSGTTQKGNSIYSSFNRKLYKIKRLEQYSHETDLIYQGQRASINLNNFEQQDYEKGMMFSNIEYPKTALIDVELNLFQNVPNLKLWSTIEFYSNTIQTQAKIHLIDKDILKPDNLCLAQIHLNKAISICYNDKFIIRNSSNEITLGGGKVLDAFPLHHRRRTKHVIELLKQRLSNDYLDLLITEIEKTIKPISLEYISKKLFIKSEILKQNIDFSLLSEKYIKINNWFWTKKHYKLIKQKIVKYIQIGHKNNPLSNLGNTFEELLSVFIESIGNKKLLNYGDFSEDSQHIFLQAALDELQKEKILDKRESTYAISSHNITLSTKNHTQINWVDQFILNQRMKAPLWSELTERAHRREINEKYLKQILFYLVKKKRIIHNNGEFLHSLNVSPIRIEILKYLSKNPQGISVSEFRDLINANRKISLIMLNIFDDEEIIVRKDDKRFITDKGLLFLETNNDSA
jgi:selenocysteine-specific elongation factor